MIVWGERDRIIPVSHGRWAAEEMPGSRFTVFDGAGHFPHLDRPLPFARALTKFVKETKPANLTTKQIRMLLDERVGFGGLRRTPSRLLRLYARTSHSARAVLPLRRGASVR